MKAEQTLHNYAARLSEITEIVCSATIVKGCNCAAEMALGVKALETPLPTKVTQAPRHLSLIPPSSSFSPLAVPLLFPISFLVLLPVSFARLFLYRFDTR